MNVLDRLLQIVAVEIAESYLIILKRISDEPAELFRELGREKSAVLLKDLYDLCAGNEENQQFLLSTDFAKLISGEKKFLTGQIIPDNVKETRTPEEIAEEFHNKSQQIVADLKENLDKIQKENKEVLS